MKYVVATNPIANNKSNKVTSTLLSNPEIIKITNNATTPPTT